MSPRLRALSSRRQLLAGLGAGLSAAAAWSLAPLFTDRSLPADRPLVVGHRGADGLAPPNTAAAIRRALAVGVDGVELDVRRTSDGELVLFHDPVLNWDSTGHGWIRNATWEDVCGAEIDGEPLITLSRALDILADAEASIYLELKDRGYTESVLETVAEYGLLERTIVISFDAEALAPAREAGVPTGLVGTVPASGLADEAVSCGATSAFCHYVPHAVPGFLEEARAAGLTAGVWKLVDTKGSIRDALAADPDVLVTNRPDYAFELLHAE